MAVSWTTTNHPVEGLNDRESRFVGELEIFLHTEHIGSRGTNGGDDVAAHFIAPLFSVTSQPAVIIEQADIPRNQGQ